jgi:hypothetical protein
VFQLDKLSQGVLYEDFKDELLAFDAQLLEFSKPKSFQGPNSVEVVYNKSYEDMCVLISSELNMDAKRMTTLEYYNAFEYIKKAKKK